MDLLSALVSTRLLAIVRSTDAGHAVHTARILAEEGIRLLEISMTTPGALDAISTLTRELPAEVIIGCGTVGTTRDVDRARDAGACFIVTPTLGPAIPYAVAAGVPVLAGALTPTEIRSALDSGAVAAKLFPASLGGPDYFDAVRAPLPDAPIVPVGGVDLDLAHAYLRRGAIAVGVGTPLVGESSSTIDSSALRMRARRFVDLAADHAA
ncbi:MAG: bifunctional 4-hydroxy-2-oxoglutarate aldolase/2-dehydro-3-deoxy-phosphogluconate aldolase [Jatrophihabitans sp.]|uniref:bifunctional 4-hydroxy-2-oxoglutarate aldolase/2-dehydro-3-deoxy-phosphogluconate aldolase n=1 Tax=Jatrophihabitans sp. TaxID=1932789 RepID=UPI003F801127